ncbi:HMA2 domain-containing protein [Fischerella sp. PCC 9605]|uniref:HMA2 domain-containing protein n=1 Tax=Fischerella sp. PCC 9605 TaxID=1173024 RepID=UPI00047E88EC|nr:hypothetical protein [Fischerella sp. PCC 9605]
MPVQSQRIDYQVVHAIAGRIRIKIPRLQRDPKYADKLQQLVKSLSAVTDVRVNYANASIVVQYNPRSVENKAIQKELANCIQQASNMGAAVSTPSEPSEKHVAETTEKHDAVTEVVSLVAEQREINVTKVIQKSVGIQVPEEYLASEQFPINVDQERKVFEIGIPAPYILEPLNAELDKFEAENEKNTELQRIRVKLEAFLKEGGFLINGRARGQFRESFIVNPFTRKKHYTPWVSITAVGTAELDAYVVDETISVKLTKVNVSGDSGKWYRKLVKYAFEYLFKNKLVAKINDALSKINGAKIQQLFFKLKGDEKLREHGQELGLTPEKLDELLELVEVNARVSPDHLWLSVQL